MKIISLGWGVQSFTLAAMVALKELPQIDYAIHADTGHESILTYQFADRWREWLEERGVKVITVKNKEPIIMRSKNSIWSDIPAFTFSPEGKAQIQRQCTKRWKINYIRRWLQSHRDKQSVEMWLGISLDEFQRMKDSNVKYITHSWPLIDLRMTRADCIIWLDKHGLEIPPKSACTFCPFHNMAEWRRIKNTPEDWAEAVKVDQEIRQARPPFDLYVHPARKPLEEIDFRTPQEMGQLELNWDQECEGICGV